MSCKVNAPDVHTKVSQRYLQVWFKIFYTQETPFHIAKSPRQVFGPKIIALLGTVKNAIKEFFSSFFYFQLLFFLSWWSTSFSIIFFWCSTTEPKEIFSISSYLRELREIGNLICDV